jgi:hypothetical protein
MLILELLQFTVGDVELYRLEMMVQIEGDRSVVFLSIVLPSANTLSILRRRHVSLRRRKVSPAHHCYHHMTANEMATDSAIYECKVGRLDH